MKQAIEQVLSSEWYDNSTIDTILSCKRKAFFNLVEGLARPVGDGANFGSAIHDALAAYRRGWGRKIEQDRRRDAFRAFGEKHALLFQTECQRKHTLENGLRILDHYFETHSAEDPTFKPVETEISFMVRITPKRETAPFWYIGRMDGIDERVSTGEWLVRETKTTGGGIDREVTRRRIDRQTDGYYWAARSFDKEVVGILLDVLFVGSKQESRREFLLKTPEDADIWERETIQIVRDWRERVIRYRETGGDRYFYRETDHCTAYGRCPYYDICLREGTVGKKVAISVAGLERRTRWNPFGIKLDTSTNNTTAKSPT